MSGEYIITTLVTLFSRPRPALHVYTKNHISPNSPKPPVSQLPTALVSTGLVQYKPLTLSNNDVHYYTPAPTVGADARLTSVCGVHRPKSRTERLTKTKIGSEVAHVTLTRIPLSTSKGQRLTYRGRGHVVMASHTACLLRPRP